MDILEFGQTRRNMIANLETSFALFNQNSKQFNIKRYQFFQQKYFLDLAVCDEAVKKMN